MSDLKKNSQRFCLVCANMCKELGLLQQYLTNAPMAEFDRKNIEHVLDQLYNFYESNEKLTLRNGARGDKVTLNMDG